MVQQNSASESTLNKSQNSPLSAKHRLGEKINVRSDGELKDWQEGMQLCQHFLEYGEDFGLDEDES